MEQVLTPPFLSPHFISTTVGFNIFGMTLCIPGVTTFSPELKAGLALGVLGIQNIMACRVFRLLRLGGIQDDLTTCREPTLRFDRGLGSEDCMEMSNLSSKMHVYSSV